MKAEYLCCIALSLFVNPVVAQTIEYTREDVAENVYAFIPSEIGVGNSVAIIGDKDVLVVDSPATVRAASRKAVSPASIQRPSGASSNALRALQNASRKVLPFDASTRRDSRGSLLRRRFLTTSMAA